MKTKETNKMWMPNKMEVNLFIWQLLYDKRQQIDIDIQNCQILRLLPTEDERKH